MQAGDFSDQYNTQLSPAEEAQFRAWAAKAGRLRDVYDYDLRGAWKASAQEAANGHLPDTYKKPNHPTFSAESVYSGKNGAVGGTWTQNSRGQWQFTPSEYNLRTYGAAPLRHYFQQNEPDARLVLPPPPRPTGVELLKRAGRK